MSSKSDLMLERTESSSGSELILFTDRRVSANQERFRLPDLKKRH